MRGSGFSLKGLLIAVTLTAVGLYALINASAVWVSILLSVTLLTLLTALLGAACRPSQRRAFWLGFAIFGWGYLLVAEVSLEKRIPLPTHLLAETLHEAISREVEYPQSEVPPGAATTIRDLRDGAGITALVTLPIEQHFNRISITLWAWLLALAGGFTARHFYVAQERKTCPETRS